MISSGVMLFKWHFYCKFYGSFTNILYWAVEVLCIRVYLAGTFRFHIWNFCYVLKKNQLCRLADVYALFQNMQTRFSYKKILHCELQIYWRLLPVWNCRLEKEIREQYVRVVLKGNKEGLKVLIQFCSSMLILPFFETWNRSWGVVRPHQNFDVVIKRLSKPLSTAVLAFSNRLRIYLGNFESYPAYMTILCTQIGCIHSLGK